MNKIIKINNINFIEVEKSKNNFSFLQLKNKILNNEELNDIEINKIWCLISFFILFCFLIYEINYLYI